MLRLHAHVHGIPLCRAVQEGLWMKKRIVSFFLVLAMCAALLPTIALADDVTVLTQEDLDNAEKGLPSPVGWDNALEYYELGSRNYRLGSNVELASPIHLRGYTSCTFDLAGHSLTGANVFTLSAPGGGSPSLTLNDSSSGQTGRIIVTGGIGVQVSVKQSTFTMNGGTITGSGTGVKSNGTFVANGGVVELPVIHQYNNANLFCEAGKSGTVFKERVSIDLSAKISGGIFRGTVETSANGSGGFINGGVFYGDVTNNSTINGGMFYGDVTNNGTINGGVFFGTVPPSIAAQYNVTFDPCNGEPAQTGAVVGNKLFPPEAPTRKGYIFDSWYKDEEAWDFAKDEIPEGTEEITLQARWKSEADGEGFVIAGGLLSGILESAANALEETFVDVSRGAYYYNAVQWAAERGIAGGVDKKHFAPDESCTRAQAVTMLWRAAGCPEVWAENPFVDVDADDYYYEAVLWAVANGITSGADEAHFGPDEPCTRGQIVTFLHRAARCYDAHENFGFTDVKTGSYCEDAVNWAVENAITNGTDVDTFSPDAPCTRAQIVTFLYRNR